jgi:RNA-directed DNA polymerase
MKKKLKKQIQAVQLGLRKRMHNSIGDTIKWLKSILIGHMNYYSVPGNFQSVSIFHNEGIRRWLKMLRRRSQRHRIIWKNFGLWVRKNFPKVRVIHPYPEMRFRARYSK